MTPVEAASGDVGQHLEQLTIPDICTALPRHGNCIRSVIVGPVLLQTRLFRQIEKVRKTVSRMTRAQVELAHISDSAVVGLIDVGVFE